MVVPQQTSFSFPWDLVQEETGLPEKLHLVSEMLHFVMWAQLVPGTTVLLIWCYRFPHHPFKSDKTA